MKNACLFLVAVIFIQPVLKAQTTKQELLSGKWKYLGVEEFGVVHAPDSIQKNDWLGMRSDGTYEWMQSGKISSGNWKLNEAAKTIVFTDSLSKKPLTYNLKKISATDLTIEYQTPDLVRTRYRYGAMKE